MIYQKMVPLKVAFVLINYHTHIREWEGLYLKKVRVW